MADPDFVDEMIAKLSAGDPEFPKLVEVARRRRELILELAELRRRQERTRAAVAEAMDTSEAFVEELESEAPDVKLSTINRYAGALGYVVQYHLIPEREAGDAPAVVVH
jgi:seryl-tRNA synthetase